MRLRANRSDEQPDGSVIRFSRCLECGQKVIVVAE
jgi:hypothetical protein